MTNVQVFEKNLYKLLDKHSTELNYSLVKDIIYLANKQYIDSKKEILNELSLEAPIVTRTDSVGAAYLNAWDDFLVKGNELIEESKKELYNAY